MTNRELENCVFFLFVIFAFTFLLGYAVSASADCDDNCAPDDPICIPCDLESQTDLQVRQCRIECITDPYGVTICRQICNGKST